MIHFTCDGCQRRIDREHETRYVLRLEVYEATDPDVDGQLDQQLDEQLEGQLSGGDAERDHLEELTDLIEHADAFGDAAPADGRDASENSRMLRFDLCSDCRRAILCNPLGRLTLTKVNFSDN